MIEVQFQYSLSNSIPSDDVSIVNICDLIQEL